MSYLRETVSKNVREAMGYVPIPNHIEWYTGVIMLAVHLEMSNMLDRLEEAVTEGTIGDVILAEREKLTTIKG